MKMPLGTEVDRGPGHTVLDGDPAPPSKGAQQPPCFRSMSIVATVARFSYIHDDLPYQDQQQVAADPQTKPTDLSCESAC